MSFNSFSSAVKLNGIKTYSGVNTTNKSFKNQFYSDIKDIDYSQYEEIDYNIFDLEKGIEEAKEKASEQPWYKTAFDYTQTIRASFTWGVLEVVENIGDGLIMLGSACMANQVSVVDTIFGTNYADKIKETASNMIAYDWTEAGYQAEMKALGVNEEIANGMAHTIAGGAGTMAGYVALSLIPGGAAVTATAGALSAAGSAADMAFKNGATYEEALTVSAVSAVAGGISGGALDKLGVAAKGAQSLGQVVGYASAGAAVAITEPVINSTAEYLTYGKDMVDENGNKVYDNFGDYYVESGGLLNTIIAGGVGAVSTGAQAFSGYKNNKSNNFVEMDSSKPVEVVEAEYNPNLKEKIFSRMPKKTSKLEKAKYIYNKLNEEMAYSAEYFYGDQIAKSGIYGKKIDITNIQDNKIVCSNWSEMYCELLTEAGITAKIMGNSHKWVTFELPDGTKWLADATQPYNGFTDLTNAKIGTKSGGFAQITDEMYNSNDLVQGRQKVEEFRRWITQDNYGFKNKIKAADSKIGYDYGAVEDLFSGAKSKANDILNVNQNSTYGEIAALKLEQLIFPQMNELDMMEGIGYYTSMRGVLDTSEQSLVSYQMLQKNDGSWYCTYKIDLQNGFTAEYIYDGKGNLTKDLIENLR